MNNLGVGPDKRGAAALISRTGVSAGLEESLNGLNVPFFGGHYQFGVVLLLIAYITSRFGMSTSLEEGLNDFRTTCCYTHGGAAIFVLHIGISARFEEGLNDLIVPLAGSLH